MHGEVKDKIDPFSLECAVSELKFRASRVGGIQARLRNAAGRVLSRLFGDDRRIFLILMVFVVFVVIRIVVWLFRSVFYGVGLPTYEDAYNYYVPGGVAYLKGALPDSFNPEHPPLGKYLIGFFAVYLRSPNLSSIFFGFLTAIVAFLITRKLTANNFWSLTAVWLLAFDSVSISVSIDPVLDVFMLFFALAGVYFVLTARDKVHYGLAGLMFGLAMASKWIAFFFIVPALAFVFLNRRYLNGLTLFAVALGGYTLPYIPLIAAKGFDAFLRLNVWMAQYMFTANPGSHNILLLPSAIIFHSTTFEAAGYNLCLSSLSLYPEGFRLLGSCYISVAETINPLLTLALFPVLYVQIRRYFANRDEARLLLLLVLLGLLVGEITFPPSNALWHYASINAVVAILTADLLADFQRKSRRRKLLSYLYLALVATWPLFARLIVVERLAHYFRSQ